MKDMNPVKVFFGGGVQKVAAELLGRFVVSKTTEILACQGGSVDGGLVTC